MNKRLIIANWKMHGDLAMAGGFAAALGQVNTVEVVGRPPMAYLQGMAEAAAGQVALGCQDISPFAEGAYTGDVSAGMAYEVGARWALVGHSERRVVHSESDQDVAAKCEAAVEAGLSPIVCVGETQQQRDAGLAVETISDQLASIWRLLLQAPAAGIAYEPVWAIGSGQVASLEDVAVMHRSIREQMRAYDARMLEKVRVIYGGSVKPNNVGELFTDDAVEGVLVGGASLDPESFRAIIDVAAEQAAAEKE